MLKTGQTNSIGTKLDRLHAVLFDGADLSLDVYPDVKRGPTINEAQLQHFANQAAELKSLPPVVFGDAAQQEAKPQAPIFNISEQQQVLGL